MLTTIKLFVQTDLLFKNKLFNSYIYNIFCGYRVKPWFFSTIVFNNANRGRSDGFSTERTERPYRPPKKFKMWPLLGKI